MISIRDTFGSLQGLIALVSLPVWPALKTRIQHQPREIQGYPCMRQYPGPETSQEPEPEAETSWQRPHNLADYSDRVQQVMRETHQLGVSLPVWT